MSQEIKCTFPEMGLKFQNLKLTILFKIAFFYYLLKCKHLELRDQWGHFGTSKGDWIRLYTLIF